MNPLIHDLLEKLLDPDEKIALKAQSHLMGVLAMSGGIGSYAEQERPFLPVELQNIALTPDELRAIVVHYTELIKSGYPNGGNLIFHMTRLLPLVYRDYLLDIIVHHIDKLKRWQDVRQAFVALDNCLFYSDDEEKKTIAALLATNNPIPVLESALQRPDADENDIGFFEHILIDLRWYNHSLLKPDNVSEAIQSGENMQYAPLHDIDLQGLDLRQANVMGASFRGSNLNDVNLEGVNLHGCQFSALARANLRNTNLSGTDLAFADANNANLTSANLQRSDVQGANLAGCNFTHADLCGANFVQANLRDAILSNAKFDETTRLSNADFWTTDTDLTMFTDLSHPDFWRGYVPDNDREEERNLSDSDFSASNLQATYLYRVTLHRSNFDGANLQYVELAQSDCDSASFRNTDMRRTNLIDANLSNTDLRGANLEDSLLWNTTFDGAQFDETTILPDGTHWSPEVDLERFTNPRHPEFDKKYYPILGIGSPWDRDKFPELYFFGD